MTPPAAAAPIIIPMGRPLSEDVVGGASPITQAAWISTDSISKSHDGFSFNLFPWINIVDSAAFHSFKWFIRLKQSLASIPCNLARYITSFASLYIHVNSLSYMWLGGREHLHIVLSNENVSNLMSVNLAVVESNYV